MDAGWLFPSAFIGAVVGGIIGGIIGNVTWTDDAWGFVSRGETIGILIVFGVVIGAGIGVLLVLVVILGRWVADRG